MHSMKSRISTLLLSLTILLGLVTVTAPVANAQLFENAKKEACKGANVSGSGNCNNGNDLDKTVQKIVDLLTIIVGVVAVVMIIINGFRFITSGGDSNSVTAARNGLIYAIVGLIIVGLSQVIVRFVIGRF